MNTEHEIKKRIDILRAYLLHERVHFVQKGNLLQQQMGSTRLIDHTPTPNALEINFSRGTMVVLEDEIKFLESLAFQDIREMEKTIRDLNRDLLLLQDSDAHG